MPVHCHAGRVMGRELALQKLGASEAGWDGSPGPSREVGPSRDVRPSRISVFSSGAALASSFQRFASVLAGKSPSLTDDLAYGQPVNDWRFQWFIFAAILLNAVQMGLQVDIKGPRVDTVWTVLSNLFTGIFAVEMFLKLWYLRGAYFTDRWNWLDFVIAWLGIADTWILPFCIDDDSGLLMPFQSLRLVRMVKLLRMRRELVALITGLIGSLKSMFWIGILLGLVIYTFGIFCAEVIGTADYSGTPTDVQSLFGTLPRSMLTLFSICIVDSWSSLVFPVWTVQPFLVPLFMVFLVITSFGLLNALIGVIVEQTTLATQELQKATDLEERQKKMDIVHTLVQMVMDIDSDSDGAITAEEMKAAEAMPEMEDFLRRIDLPPGFSLAELHMMLDQDGSGLLDRDEFILGMYRLIFCNEFHAHCLDHLSVARTQRAIQRVSATLKHDIQEACDQLRADFGEMFRKHTVASVSAAPPAVTALAEPPNYRSMASLVQEQRERREAGHLKDSPSRKRQGKKLNVARASPEAKAARQQLKSALAEGGGVESPSSGASHPLPLGAEQVSLQVAAPGMQDSGSGQSESRSGSRSGDDDQRDSRSPCFGDPVPSAPALAVAGGAASSAGGQHRAASPLSVDHPPSIAAPFKGHDVTSSSRGKSVHFVVEGETARAPAPVREGAAVIQSAVVSRADGPAPEQVFQAASASPQSPGKTKTWNSVSAAMARAAGAPADGRVRQG